MKNVITIDGPSGAGKSTIARLLAKRLGYSYLDTGALYRAIAWKVKMKGINVDDESELRNLLNNTTIMVNGERVLVDGVDVSSEIRTGEMGELSSRVSAIPIVREFLLSIQRDAGQKGRVVLEGRDTGTVIFPDAMNKFFLDASIEERARRRYKELKNKGYTVTFEETIDDIERRDRRDSTRNIAPLKRTDDMVYIDTTTLSIDEVVTEMIKNLRFFDETP